MQRRSFSGNVSSDWLVSELIGYTELRMAVEAVKRAELILETLEDRRSFVAAVNALLTFSTELDPFRLAVEAAYNRLSPNDKNRVGHVMLWFCCARNDFEMAMRFIPKHFRGRFAVVNLMFAAEVWLALGNHRKIRRFIHLMENTLHEAVHPFLKQRVKRLLKEGRAMIQVFEPEE